VPRDEVYREDMVRLYRCRPTAEKPHGIPVLIVYALVGRFQMIDLEADRSFVRKLLASGFDVYFIDWGLPARAQRWLTIDDYVSGYLDHCVDVVSELSGSAQINLLGICQGGVFTTCYASLYPRKVRNLALTVTPIDFHGDKKEPQTGAGYMNRWTRSLSPQDIDDLVDAYGSAPGSMIGFAFLMMNPVSTMPVLNIYATGDTIIPVSCSKDVGRYFGTRDYTEVPVPGGHIGTFVGGKAQKILAPTLAEWLEKRS